MSWVYAHGCDPAAFSNSEAQGQNIAAHKSGNLAVQFCYQTGGILALGMLLNHTGEIGLNRLFRNSAVDEAVAELSTTAKSKLADFEKISGQGDLSLSE